MEDSQAQRLSRSRQSVAKALRAWRQATSTDAASANQALADIREDMEEVFGGEDDAMTNVRIAGYFRRMARTAERESYERSLEAEGVVDG